MTTSTVNKIVRTNFNLKPWILSKNTSEIVSTCIEKIYKQIPNNFKNDLMQTKIASPKPENMGPIRSFRSQERPQEQQINTPNTKPRVGGNATGNRLLSQVMTNSKKTGAVNFAANKKLLKSPNYKIYGSRRFGSSASSSSASIFRRFDERRRNRSQQNQFNFLRRSIGSHTGRNSFSLHPGLAKYLVPARNQHMQSRLGSVPQAIEVSSNIQRDLMMIDNKLKDRISLARTKLTKLSPELNEAEEKAEISLRGWNHPPAPELFFSRFNERGVASAELQEQHRKLRAMPQTTKKLEAAGLMDEKHFIGTQTKRRTRAAENVNVLIKEPSPRNAHQNTGKVVAIQLEHLPSQRVTSSKKLAEPVESPLLNEVPPLLDNAPNPPTSASVAHAGPMVSASASPNAAHYHNSRFNRSSFFQSKKY